MLRDAKSRFAGECLLQKSQIVEVFLFGKIPQTAEKLRNANLAVENQVGSRFLTAGN